MAKTKLYDLIKSLLEANPLYRNSGRDLIWRIWESEGSAKGQWISKDKFLHAKNPESIRRARQKVQENNPHLNAIGVVAIRRKQKEAEKGTFVYRENVNA